MAIQETPPDVATREAAQGIDWQQWANGMWWRLEMGVDVPYGIAPVVKAARLWADASGRTLSTRAVVAGVRAPLLYVQFTPTER